MSAVADPEAEPDVRRDEATPDAHPQAVAEGVAEALAEAEAEAEAGPGADADDEGSGIADASGEMLDRLEATHDAEAFTDELLAHPPDPEDCESADQVEDATVDDLRLPPDTALRVIAWTGVLLATIAVGAVLFLARGVFLPIAAAGILNLLLSPLVNGLRKWRIPAPFGALIVLGGAGLLFAGLGAAILPSLRSQLADAPEIIQEVQTRLAPELDAYYDLTAQAERTEQAAEAVDDPGQTPAEAAAEVDPNDLPEEPVEVEADVTDSLTGDLIGDDLFNAARSLASLTFATLVLLYFLLASGDAFTRACTDLTKSFREKREVVATIVDAQRAISAYLLTITCINAGLGVVIGVTMGLLGVPNPVLWGVLACLFNFVPYVGALVGAAAVGLVAFGAFGGFEDARVLLAPALYFTWTTIEGNVVTPQVLGDRLDLNAPVIIGWLLLLGWLWGVPGILLAVPMLAAFKILCDHVTVLGPFGKFLVEGD